ncbi:MAG: alpha/beta hydrolase [Pseudomonadota bacterium]
MIWGLLAVTLGFCALVHLRATRRERRIAQTHPPEGEIVSIDGVPIHYRVLGSGPDLVLLHGANGNMKDFTLHFAQRLTDRYRVILFDRPGLGWTGRPTGYGGAWNTAEESPASQAKLLQRAADQIGAHKPIILGHSFGGIVALAWAQSRPETTRGLVLVSGVAEPWPGKLGWTYRVMGSTLGTAFFVPLITAFLPKRYLVKSVADVFAPQKPPKGYKAHVGPALSIRRSTLRANAQQVNALRPHVVEMQKDYAALRLPIEMIHGDVDTIVPLEIHARVLMQDVPNGALTILPGVGHMPHHVAPEAVEAAIDRAAARAGLR